MLSNYTLKELKLYVDIKERISSREREMRNLLDRIEGIKSTIDDDNQRLKDIESGTYSEKKIINSDDIPF